MFCGRDERKMRNGIKKECEISNGEYEGEEEINVGTISNLTCFFN